MASEDIYLRKDVYEADQRALIAVIEKGNSEILRVLERNYNDLNIKLEQYRNESKAELAQFREEVNNRFNKFEGEVNSRFGEVNDRFNKFEGAVSGRFDKLEARFDVLTGRVASVEQSVDKLDRRIDRIEDYVGTGIAFIAMLVTIVVFIEPIARFVRKIFKPEPAITLEQIEALIDAKLNARQ